MNHTFPSLTTFLRNGSRTLLKRGNFSQTWLYVFNGYKIIAKSFDVHKSSYQYFLECPLYIDKYENFYFFYYVEGLPPICNRENILALAEFQAQLHLQSELVGDKVFCSKDMAKYSPGLLDIEYPRGLPYGYIHGDVSLDNIIVNPVSGEWVLIDYEWIDLRPLCEDLGNTLGGLIRVFQTTSFVDTYLAYYDDIRELTTEELDIIDLSIDARLEWGKKQIENALNK